MTDILSNNQNNSNNNEQRREQQQTANQQRVNAIGSSSDSMSMTSSFSHSHLETDTTHSHDHLAGDISPSRTSIESRENDKSSLTTRQVQFPMPQNYIDNNNNNNNNNSSSCQEHSIYMPPTEPPPSTSSYSKDKDINQSNQSNQSNQLPPPPSYSEPPQYTPRSKNNADVILEVGNHGNVRNIEEIKASLQTDKSIRNTFVRKVYFLLSMQLLLTVVLTAFFMYYPPVANFVKEHQWMFFISWIMAFITLLILFWQRKKSPLNLILLILFTSLMSYGIGTLVSMYNSKVVLQAFLITLGVFLALTAFTFQSKYDFSSWGPFLYAGLWVVIFALVIKWLFPYEKGFHIAISVICALLFSAYIIYDTYMIIKRVSPEEYILATVDLYLDVLNLFVAILAIIGGTSDR